MNKKMIRLLIAVAAFIVVAGSVYFVKKGDQERKTVHIVVQVESEKIIDEEVTTNSATLADLLLEMAEQKKIQLIYSESTYGMYIQGLGTSETVYMEDGAKNLYWNYESVNNETCVQSGFCPAAEQLPLADGDEFVFDLSVYEG